MNNEKKDGTLTEITVFINAHKAVYEKWPHGEPTSVPLQKDRKRNRMVVRKN